MSKIETGDLDLSGFNLLASDSVVSDDEKTGFGNSLFEEDPGKTGDESPDGKGGIVDARTGKDDSIEIKNVASLEEETDEEDDDEEDDTPEEVSKDKKSDKKSDSKKEEQDDNEDDEDDADDDDEEDSPFKTFGKFLDESGIADFDEEEFEDSEKGLLTMIDKTVEKAVNKYKESVPSEAKAFLEYLEAGGDPKKYVEDKQSMPDYKSLDDNMLSKESVQKALVTDWMRLQGYSDEEVAEQLKDYEESVLLEKQAKRVLPKLAGKQQEYEDGLVEGQKQEHQKRIKDHQDYVESIKKTIDEKEEIAGFQIPPKKKEDFFKYITESDKEGKTRLLSDIEADSEAQLKMAWLMYNKFDFSTIEKKVKTKVSSKLRDSLSNLDSSTKLKGQSKRTRKAKDTDDVDLSSFRRLL